MDHKTLFSHIDRNLPYVIDVLKRMIAVDTSVPPGRHYGDFVDLVAPEFEKFGFTTQKIIVPEEKVNLMPWNLSGERVNLVATRQNGKPPVTAYAHMDVVPVEEPWTRDPFGGEIVDGKLYGRGAVDMKGATACFLGALKALHETGTEPAYSVRCCLCTDEEIGVYPGARYLAEEGYFSPHILWLEIGSLDPAVFTGLAGAIRFDITSVGRSCHSGLNYLGVNAIEEFVPVLNELIALKKQVEQRLSGIPALPIPGCPFERMTPMFNLNMMHGGVKENIVPSECTLTINRRYLPDERLEDVISEVENAVKNSQRKTRLIDMKIETVHCYPPVVINPDSFAVKKKLAAAKAVYGYDEFIFGGFSGSSDLGFVIEALKPQSADIACFGAGSRGSDLTAHSSDEFVYLDDLAALTKELAYYLAE
ncbi:MAG: ArgE/DapE family deacylase [Desulfobacterales bacterium]